MIKKQEELRETANLIAAKGRGYWQLMSRHRQLVNALLVSTLKTQKRIGRLIGA